MSEIFKHIAPGEFPGSGEYNRLTDAVMALLSSSNVQYFVDGSGVHVRRMPESSSTGDVCKMKLSGNQIAAAAGITQIEWDTIEYAGGASYFADVANYRINILADGLYMILTRAGVQHGASAAKSISLAETTRGAATGITVSQDIGIVTATDYLTLTDIVELTTADYIESWITNYDPVIDWTIFNSLTMTSLTIMRIQ